MEGLTETKTKQIQIKSDEIMIYQKIHNQTKQMLIWAVCQ